MREDEATGRVEVAEDDKEVSVVLKEVLGVPEVDREVPCADVADTGDEADAFSAVAEAVLNPVIVLGGEDIEVAVVAAGKVWDGVVLVDWGV